MFLTGGKYNFIKSRCLLEYAIYLRSNVSTEKAISYYLQAINLTPNDSYAYVGTAMCHFSMGRFRDALGFCKKADSIRFSKWNKAFLFIIYESLGETKSAEVTLQILKEHLKDNAAAASDQISAVYYYLGMYDKAEYYIKKALEMQPMDANIHYNLASIYIALNKLQEAKPELQFVLRTTISRRLKKYSLKRLKQITTLSDTPK